MKRRFRVNVGPEDHNRNCLRDMCIWVDLCFVLFLHESTICPTHMSYSVVTGPVDESIIITTEHPKYRKQLILSRCMHNI